MKTRDRPDWLRNTRCIIALGAGLLLAARGAMACGLDWTLPQAHFEGVDEHGYVAYWEKIGELNLGGMVLPVHIGFNSHREASSPVLGKGWIVALLESHVEPINENAVNVLMPDGWTFLFLRNANTETWRGNSGWVGETNDSLFTITAPCGWKIKYDGGKIQELAGAKVGTLTYSYNGGVATEIDRDGSAVLQVERNPATGTAAALVIGGQRIGLSLAQRPRVVSLHGQNLIDGLDNSLASLQEPDGRNETFAFGTDKALNPTLTIREPDKALRAFAWDAATRQITTDGGWTYALVDKLTHLRISRVTGDNRVESYEEDDATGMTAEKRAGSAEVVTYRFVSGPLAGSIRKMEELESSGDRKLLYSASYYPTGELMREFYYPDTMKMYAVDQRMLKETIGGQLVYEQDLDSQGRATHVIDAGKALEVKTTYDAVGARTTEVFQKGMLLYTENIGSNNKLTSLTKGTNDIPNTKHHPMRHPRNFVPGQCSCQRNKGGNPQRPGTRHNRRRLLPLQKV